jgi:MinD superfamily P-loop ATPase
MGFQSIREVRDLLIGEIKSSAELTVWTGYAQVDPQKCSRCGLCADIGHCNAIEVTEEAAAVDPELCQGCSTCIDICPEQAISMKGAD